MFPEDKLDEDTTEIKKHKRYINKCQDAAWKRWGKEYLRFRQERRNMMKNTKEMKIKVEDKVLINGKDKNKGN